MRYINKYILIGIFPLIVFTACSYSFTGASVPPHLETVAIPLFKDRSGSAEPNLDNVFTNELIDKFINDNTLSIIDKANADALLECTITSLRDTPEAVSGETEKASLRRITIKVKVKYTDLVMKETIFNKDFSNYATYDADNFSEERPVAIENAINLITEDILLGVVSNW
jgi:hypothetical protein